MNLRSSSIHGSLPPSQGGGGNSAKAPNKTRTTLVWAIACAFAVPAIAQNLPTGFTNITGVNAPTVAGNTMTVTQTAQRGIAQWTNFSIGSGHAVNFVQPSASSVLLNRVVGGNPSQIAGSLNANGSVYLINPSGVTFSPGSSVSVGGLVASTLDVSNQNFLAGGRLTFERTDGNNATVSNAGAITVAPGGTVALLGAQVSNSGSISAADGTVGLVSGRKVNVDFNGDGLTTFTIPADSQATHALVENLASGAIDADGGRIALQAASTTAQEQVVNQSGILRARSLSVHDGQIVLGGGAVNRVQVSGTLDVSGQAGTAGGSVQVQAGQVLLGGAQIDASGARGGNIAINAQADPSLANSGIIAMDGDSALHADATGAQGNGGNIALIGDASTRAHGTLTARAGNQGGDGGLIETSAAALDVSGLRVDASAPAGKAGQWLLDPLDVTVMGGNSGIVTPTPDPFYPDDYGTTVYADDIAAALNLGSNVTITTTCSGAWLDACAIGIGDITFDSAGGSIIKTAGGNATLTFEAEHDINALGGWNISSSAGALDVNFNTNGSVYWSNSTIATNGGSVTMSSSSGVWINGASGNINAASGSITLHTVGGNLIVGMPVTASHVELSVGDGSNITQTAGGIITADTLLAYSPLNVVLQNPGNRVSTVAGVAGASSNFSFVSALPLTIGTVAAPSHSVSGIEALNVLVQTLGGTLTLAAPVTVTGHGSVDLVAASTFQNPGGNVIDAPVWRIWAGTWIGETRGGLAGTGVRPNIYGCAYPGLCGTSVWPNDDHFIYAPVSTNPPLPDVFIDPPETWVYASNFGRAPICLSTGTLDLNNAQQEGEDDVLALEWSRVRSRPNLTSCIETGQRNGCADF
jgi:filamentous hemagglutinin family protein